MSTRLDEHVFAATAPDATFAGAAGEPASSPLADPVGRLATYGLSAVVALSPLVFGSVQTRVVALWVILLAIVALLAIWTRWDRPDRGTLAVFALVGGAWLSVLVLQSVDAGPMLAPLIHPIWRESSALLAETLPGRVSAVRDLPLTAAGPQIANALALFCALVLGRRRSFADALLQTFAWSSLLYAAYGIASLLIAPDHVLWLEKVAYRNVLTGTFINANTAAVYFGAGAVTWFLLFVRSLDLKELTRRNIVRAVFGDPRRRTLVCAAAFFILLSATFMTGSRLGSTVTLLALAGSAMSYFRAPFRSWRAVAATAGLVITATVIMASVFGGAVNTRFDTGGLSDGGRREAYRSTLLIIRDHPLLGTGLGSFQWVFPQYRSASLPMDGVWDRAHSTPLELAAEMGVPFAAIVVLVWFGLLGRLAFGMIRRRRARIFPVAAFWICVLALLHSLLDFSLQIPGFALIVMVLGGIGLAQASGQRKDVPPLP